MRLTLRLNKLQLLCLALTLAYSPQVFSSEPSIKKVIKAETEILYLDVFINGIKQKGIYQLIKDDHDYWFGSDQLGIFNLKSNIFTKKIFFDREFSLLPPFMTVKINMNDLSAEINVPAEMMDTVVLKDEPEAVIPSPSTYAFYWNYDLSLYHQPQNNHAQLLTAHKPVLTSPFGSISNQFMTKTGPANNVVRLETSFLKDFSNQIRVTAGDFATDTPSFITTTAAAGVKISKGQQFQSGSLSYPSLNLEGFIPRPADAEIWINDALRLKKELPMGGFLLNNLNLPQGAHTGELVIKDLNGLVTSIPFSYYGDPELLRPGLTSYSYALGFLRKNYGIKSFSYGGPAFFGSQKIGLSNYWTTSAHTQLSLNKAMLALEQRFKISSIGSVAFATGASKSSLGLGYLFSPQLQLDILHANFRTRAIFSTAKYNPITLESKKRHYPSVNISTGLRLDLPYLRYSSINHLFLKNDNKINHLIGMRQSLPTFFDINTNLAFDYELKQKNFFFFVTLSYQFADDHRLSLEMNKNEHLQTSGSINGSFDDLDDHKFFYNVNTKLESAQVLGDMSYENNYLRSRLNILGSKNMFAYGGSFAGSFQVMKNHLFFSRPVERGLLLIELPGQEGVKIYQNSSKILGTTNSDGLLMVPNLEPYYLARLGVDSKDISIFTSSKDFNNGIELIPGYQTAHQIRFDSKMVRYLHFSLIKDNTKLMPGTKLSIEDQNEPTYVMNEGDVNLEVMDDKTKVSGHDEAKSCTFEIPLLARKEDTIIEEFGDVPCKP